MQKNSLNKVILIGNLGQDPEARFTPQGTAVTNLSIATNESWKDQSGEMQDRTEWHRVVLFSRLAEIATVHPLLANFNASALPIPVLPPVIQITFLFIFNCCIVLKC